MSFDKNYPNRKDHRKPFSGAKAIDRTCRNHKGCNCCLSNRTHANRKRLEASEENLKERFENV
jgi:hypothetical protein